MHTHIRQSVEKYMARHGLRNWKPRAALIDMDGVLYDSMPYHARAWKQMTDELGWNCTEDEFFLYEGMTGRATIALLMQRHEGRVPTADEADKLYARKAEIFIQMNQRTPMPGAGEMLRELERMGLKRVLVTGSAQSSLLKSLNRDYPGAFATDKRITALDVTHGKPNPEPYLKGLELAGAKSTETIVIENAPLGVKAGHLAGCFTIGLTTGPIPEKDLIDNGADVVFPSMQAFADALKEDL